MQKSVKIQGVILCRNNCNFSTREDYENFKLKKQALFQSLIESDFESCKDAEDNRDLQSKLSKFITEKDKETQIVC